MRFLTIFFLALLPVLAACTAPVAVRDIKTQVAARLGGFSRQEIKADPFILTSYERVRQPGMVAAVYIEGDGLAWLSRTRASKDPTPTNPVALKLADEDKSANVVYLSRPCQFSKGEGCSQEYWTGKRFSPEVIAAMGKALDDIKKRHNIYGFNLMGFSGGGAVAALLAARRDDILSLRTVAGNLDTAAFTRLHRVTPLAGSLNPADVAEKIVRIPQKHFVGAEDKVVPRKIGESFVAATHRPDCIALTEVEGASHEDGWVEQWPKLLEQPLEGDCM